MTLNFLTIQRPLLAPAPSFHPGGLLGEMVAHDSSKVVATCGYEFRSVDGKGRGFFVTSDVPAGQHILTEEPAVIGPKQMSQLVRDFKEGPCPE